MSVRIMMGDCREILPTLEPKSVHCCVTSPPYFGLRDYGHAGQIGLEPTPDAYVAELVAVFREVRRVLRDDGTVWLNLGDSYAGSWGAQGHRETPETLSRNSIANHPKTAKNTGTIRQAGLKPKDLTGIPWRVAFALQADGWYLRQDIIWYKPNPMPESVTDRCTKAHEYIFLLSKSARYYFDAEAIAEPATRGDAGSAFTTGKTGAHQLGRAAGRKAASGTYSEDSGRNGGSRHPSGGWISGEARNRRSVWTVATQPFSGAHFATFPPALIKPCILAGCPVGGTVLDPFMGAGTTGLVADRFDRNCIGIELNPEYSALGANRLDDEAGMFANVEIISQPPARPVQNALEIEE